MRRWALVCVFTVALVGCSTVTAPHHGLSLDDKDAARQVLTENRWAATGLFVDQRPSSPAVTVISGENWPDAYVSCMKNAGFDGYVVATDGDFTYVDYGLIDQRSDTERLSDYLCTMSYEIEGQFDAWYNPAEIDYLYDYYRQSLVPCLEARGLAIEAVPTKLEFFNALGFWHPYYSLYGQEQLHELGADRIMAECPATPTGMNDSEFLPELE